jgi:choline dehydrogenase-like flavoprotein
MGVDEDAGAVVDTKCRVRGFDNLWVVDGSVLPAITSRGPHATIVMIGHRAAEFVASG